MSSSNTRVRYWFALYPGEKWFSSPWLFIALSDDESTHSLCTKDYPAEMQTLLKGAIERGVRMHGVLTWGVPLVTRASPSVEEETAAKRGVIASNTEFVPGVPLGRMSGDEGPLVYSHVSFVAYFYWDTAAVGQYAVRILGVEAIPALPVPVSQVVHYTYSVAWRPVDPSFSSLFPTAVTITHYEWWPTANSFLMLFCGLLSVFAIVVNVLPVKATEQQVVLLVGRHLNTAPEHLPIHFVFYYMLAAMGIYCGSGVLTVVVATGAVMLFQVSQLYRWLTVLSPIGALLLALGSGYQAMAVCSWAFQRWPALTLTRVLPSLAALLWAVSGSFVLWNGYVWTHPLLRVEEAPIGLFLESPHVLLFASALVAAVPLMWLGAFLHWRLVRIQLAVRSSAGHGTKDIV